tara:strand:+ start:29945 stop:30130 length:186 start_codon:yes stop_codon:yes gene_type:complete
MKYLLRIFLTIPILISVTSVTLAQPGLPTAPSQAPIDGGLGILAAAGGVYAWKKLKRRKED